MQCATTTTTTTRYQQTLGPRSLYIPLFVSTLQGTKKHWDPVVVIWGGATTKIIHQVPFPAAGPLSVYPAARILRKRVWEHLT